MPSLNSETNKFWQEHIDKFSTFSGSGAEYCRENNLRESQFYYHKMRLDTKTKANPFATVKLTEGKKSQIASPLPDPKWLAQFILAIVGKGN